MIYALWIVAVSQAIQATISIRAGKLKGLLPKVLRRNRNKREIPRVTEMP